MSRQISTFLAMTFVAVLPGLSAAQEKMPAAEPPLLVTLSAPGAGLVDQPIVFKATVTNKHKTALEGLHFSVICDKSFTPGEGMGFLPVLHVAKIAAGETQTLSFEMTPRRVSMVPVELVHAPAGKDEKPLSNKAAVEIRVHIDPKTPEGDLLPKASPLAAAEKLPRELSEVPEVCLHEPQKSRGIAAAAIEIACAIDRINHLNRQKTDGFMAALLAQRPSFAGLPFVMGDACRIKEERREQHLAALKSFRELQRTSAENEKDPTVMMDTHYRHLFAKYHVSCDGLDSCGKQKVDVPARIAATLQIVGGEKRLFKQIYVADLAKQPHADAARALAQLAIFAEEAEVRALALDALKGRPAHDYTEILLKGLSYPWPAIAERSADVIVKLGRKDLVSELKKMLERPDPRAPLQTEVGGKKSSAVREVVRINHLRNCLLCHAPADHGLGEFSTKERDRINAVSAQMPVPGEALTSYYQPSHPDILVRFDVTYLRQDFSAMLRVEDADPWPEMQRFDFVVRTRPISAAEAARFAALLRATPSPYVLAAQDALRRL